MSREKGFRPPVALRSADQMTVLCLCSKIFIALLLSLLSVIGMATLSVSAAGAGIITVCPAGPPQCDYAAIQPALEAAGAGDTVLVKPGTYTGQLTLKSHVALESSGGPAVTIITATQGPVVAASGVVSATLQGVSISGQAIVTDTLGIDLRDSDLGLSNCIVSGLHGKDGNTAAPNGETVMAIRSGGESNLVIADSTIRDIRGGNGLADNVGGAQGGDAIAVTATGSARITLVSTIIRDLSGGSAGSDPGTYVCAGSGGSATGVQTDGDVQLTVSNSQVRNLQGGAPCSALAANCVERAGATVGIRAAGGVLHVRNSQFSDFLAQPAPNSRISHAIYTTHTSETWLERNAVTSLSARGGYVSQQARQTGPDSLFCIPPPGNVIAIMSDSDARFVAVENVLDKLAGSGWGGQAVGVLARNVADARFSRNQVSHVSGGFAGLTAIGFRLDHLSSLQLNANGLREIHGGDAPYQFYSLYLGDDGGSAAGIELNVVTAAAITNNAISSVTGGHATTDCRHPAGGACPGKSGGDAIALSVSGSSAGIWNNSAYRTVAGLGGTASGQPGKTVGLRLTGAGDVIAVNNALVKHGTGILSAQPNPPVLLRNDLWENDQDYDGVTPGATDLHVAPDFVNPENGDLHLSPASPLIDAGTNSGIPPDDIDGQPRPLDGNNDGLTVTDIGADEHRPGVYGAKTVDRVSASAGDELTYQLALTNPSVLYSLSNVNLTDPLPGHTTFIPGSLSGSSGSWGYADGMITWTCALPPGVSATLTFKAKVDDSSGPLAIVNRAVVDDRVGAPQVIEAVTLVNPLRTYLPTVEKAH